MDTLKDIRLLARVSRTGSLSAAGRETGMSAATVWRHLNALEERLGSPLLLRSSRGIKLTDAGTAFLERAETIADQFDEVVEIMGSFQSTPQGLLHLHSTVAVGMNRIAPQLPRFLRRYPELRVNLWISQETPNLTEQKIDLSVRFGRQPDSNLTARKLASLPRLVVASPDYLERRGDVGSPEELLRHDCLVYRYGPLGTSWSFLSRQGLVEVPIPALLQSNTVEPLRLAALEGLGIALLPSWWVEDDIAAGRLRVLLPDWSASATDFDSNIYAVWHRGRQSTPKMRALIDFLVEVFDDTTTTPAD
ncbi:LysR family transcriptional regulator [Roseococcus sp.]|uniref:LysR family transcriptional regulator n=1 Tax=Roseococcus sp. TaxID=2109646 RepID=UPI003BAC91AC